MINAIPIIGFTILFVPPLAYFAYWIIGSEAQLKKHQSEWDKIKKELIARQTPYDEFMKAYDKYCEQCYKNRDYICGACYPRI